ncbi:hypothetical protein GQ600_15336 [Phytophthora cactorum]|nr:hypothetical protein GQ600_15336 [Phytophthora cactorum]
MQRNPLRSRFVPSHQNEESSEPLVDRPQYDPPKGILKRLGSQPATINQIARPSNPEEEPVKTQITLVEVSGDHNTEPTGSTSDQVARMTAADEVEKTEEPATSTQVSPDRQLT